MSVAKSLHLNQLLPILSSSLCLSGRVTAVSVCCQKIVSLTNQYHAVAAGNGISLNFFDSSFASGKGIEMGRRSRRGTGKKINQKEKLNHPKKMPKFQQDQDHSNVIQYREDGMRKIKPYIFLFTTHAKGRWLGKKLMDVFQKEFRFETPLYYKAAIGGGLIRLNGKPAKPDTVFRNHDFLQSRVHRHEPPVSGQPLEIITQDEDFIVINKPSSIPIHPSGKYRHNSIVYLMAKEHGLKGLHTFYRLDRLTSGVFIFVKSVERVKTIDRQMRGRELHKVYMCKVNGEFPSEPVECSEPIFAVSHKIGVCRVSPEGKPAKTWFQRVSFDGQTSVIKCTPFTGRMHQIRVHMQYLGFPIINDPLYTGSVWGPEQGKGGKMPFATDEEFIAELTRIHNKEHAEKLTQQDCNMLVSGLDGSVQEREQNDANESQICDDGISNKTTDCKEKSLVLNVEENMELSSDKHAGTDCNSLSPIKQDRIVVLKSEFAGDRTELEAVEKVQSRTSLSTSEVLSSECAVDHNDATRELDKTQEKVGEGEMHTTNSIVCVDESCEPNAKRTKYDDSSVIDSTQGKDTATTESPQGKDTASELGVQSQTAIYKCKTDSDNCCVDPKSTSDNVSSNVEKLDTDSSRSVDDKSLQKQEGKVTDVIGDETVDIVVQKSTTSSNDHKNPERTCEGDNDIPTSSTDGASQNQETGDVSTCMDVEEEKLNQLAIELCRECKQPLPDPEPEKMMLYLHALSYKGPDFEFSTPLPQWAKEHMERTGSQMP